MISSIKIILTCILIIISIYLFLIVYKKMNIKKEYRFKQYNQICILIIEIVISFIIYLSILIINKINPQLAININNIFKPTIIVNLILSIYLLYKAIYKIYFNITHKTQNNIEENLPKHYYEINKKYYILPSYSNLYKIFKIIAIIFIVGISIYFGIAYCIKKVTLQNLIEIIDPFLILIVLLLELSYYFDGIIEDEDNNDTKNKIKKNKEDFILEEINKEYHNVFKNKLLGSFEKNNAYEYKIIKEENNNDYIAKNILDKLSLNDINKFRYSKILNPIIMGNNIILESCLLESFSDILLPIINLLFTSSKRMLFICDNKETIKYCEKWLEELEIKSNTSNSNIVVEVIDYDNTNSIKKDNNVDIYISTVDLALENKKIYENIDVVFGLNIDKIISENELNLNLLVTAIANNQEKCAQYILFGNRLNGLKQTISQVFMNDDFKYQVMDLTTNDKLIANFFKKEKGWMQLNILPNYSTQYLGELLPLAATPLKYNANKLNIISSNKPYNDEISTLQISQSLLKKYIQKDIINIEDAFNYVENENNIKIDDKSIVIVEDTNNNLALVLQNYMKYAKKEMLLNIVSAPYLLRDYIISNIDFFIANAELVSNILPIPKSNIKLSVYKIINQLCSGYVREDVLLKEIQNCEINTYIDIFENNQITFITKALQDLTYKAFGTNIFFSTYLIQKQDKGEKCLENNKYYKLLDTVKKELPEKLFKNIYFIDSEQKAKILKKIPVYELYQNYLENQYISFDGKYYLIDKIDYDNGIVELIHTSINKAVSYRQCREINNIIHKEIIRELPTINIRDSILRKKIITGDVEIKTDGYYEFDNYISFIPGEFSYKKIDSNKKGLIRNLKSNNILSINISNKIINKMTEEDKFKISFTLSVLLNEIFETLFSNIKQYILVRNVIKEENILKDYKKEEIVKLYKPIIDKNVDDGINIYITEDTELEKGIIDAIINNFENIIMPLIFDYLNWILKEDNALKKEIVSNNNEYINIKEIDKLSFLKYGKKTISDCFDLENTYNILNSLIINSEDTITNNRVEYINKRSVKEEKTNKQKSVKKGNKGEL